MQIDYSEHEQRELTDLKSVSCLDLKANSGLIVKAMQLMLSKSDNSIDDESVTTAIQDVLDEIERKSPSTKDLSRESQDLESILIEALTASDNPVHLIRHLPHDKMLKPLVERVVSSDSSNEQSLYAILPLMCCLLQYTDAFNFSILTKIRQMSGQTKRILEVMLSHQDVRLAKALIMGTQAQPYLIELLNMAPLFVQQDEACENDQSDFALLKCHLQNLVYKVSEDSEKDNTDKQEQKDVRDKRLSLVQSLYLNKRAEKRAKQLLETDLLESVIEMDEPKVEIESNNVTLKDGTIIATTPYVMDKVESILQEVEEQPFGHFAIRGPPGSGKMTLIRLADHILSSRQKTIARKTAASRPNEEQDQSQTSRFLVVTLEETFDSKNLVGTYVCNETGEFVFKKGPLTVAAEQGLWLILRNIEDTPSDLLSFLLPLVEQNTLQVTSTFAIKPKLGFRIFALTRAQENSAHPSAAEETIAPLVTLLKQTELISLMPEHQRVDLEAILRVKYGPLFASTQIGTNVHTLLQTAIAYISVRFAHLKMHLLDYKPASVTQMFSLYDRVCAALADHLQGQEDFEQTKGAYLSQGQRQLIIEEVHDVYLAYMYDKGVKKQLIADMVSHVFNLADDSTLDGQMIAEYITELGRDHGSSNEQCFYGRASLAKSINVDEESKEESKVQAQTSKFVYTGATVRSLEQICKSTSLNEAMLLVGETGTGKTTIVQELSKSLGKKLHVFNMNQNTDSADLLGGFKSVDLKYLLTPVYRLFLQVFGALLNKEAANNAKFLTLMQKSFEQNQVKEFIQCLNHGLKSIKRSKNRTDEYQSQISQLERQTSDLQKRAKKLVSGGGFIFQFVEGTLIKSIQQGDWILLDEINLASDSVLNKLATIVQGNHILLNERADIVETKRHEEFRIFMCMNPPYSSAGKKQLPFSLRSKLTEIYVNELENEADLWDIIDRNTKSLSNENVSCLTEEHKRMILQFYKAIRIEVGKQMRRSNIGLRNLCRALFFIKSAIALRYPAIKAIYDSLLTCFASHLDQQLQENVRLMIMKLFEIKKLPKLALAQEDQDDRFVYLEGNVIPKGEHKPENFDAKNFILTPSFKSLLRQLSSVVAISNFAVILEGPTSAGKTSCVQYLAQVTHNKVIRINNHMHTDVQEYLGSYVPDAQTGKLIFQEGVLVEAVRHGYWVILDELNLAPSEVLEALNRLLDDNRELHIVETQTVIKAHPRFRIFATQNPTEGYGGRKELSEAFKNRFVLIRVLDVPTEELKEILVKKCAMPLSRAALMIKVMEQLQIYRSQANLFSGKNAIITVRDLLKWAGRVNLNNSRGDHMEHATIAIEGFYVLGERSRNQTDKLYIKQTIEKVFSVQLDIEELYEAYFDKNLKTIFDRVPAELNLPKIIPSKQLKRLAVLVEKCLRNREPVLLVGETGCGKTTLCQVFASEVTKQTLMQINCHQNTETSDFIGCMRTRKNLKQTQDQLCQLLEENASKIIDEDFQRAFQQAKTLKRKTKIVLTELSKSQEDPEISQVIEKINSLSEDLNCVFEWHDGILVEAMQEGGLLLIDEISLANDSVLERLNSVFEQDRVLMVTEKSSQEAIKIVAHEKFNMVATMNPSGDFGKKELSPALRNRMTEIWVESYFQQSELLTLQKELSAQEQVFIQVEESVDLFLIVSKLCEDAKLPQSIALSIFNMINYLASFSTNDSMKFQALKRKSLSIRDILCIIDFIKKNNHKMDLTECFREAIELVIVDGLCLGIDTAGTSEQEAIIDACQGYLGQVQSCLLPALDSSAGDKKDQLVNSTELIGVSHYSLSKKEEAANVKTKFAFDAGTTKTNLMKLLRAFSLEKPILIEGPPGVGKTALVEQVAKVTGRKLVRVNLSEQTDMMDLLGSEYPTSASKAEHAEADLSEDEDQDEIHFRWGDGVLLSAIKEGHWLLIDEMNLAQQSILEGLNAILDHRRTVYIPELNQEFQCHPDFFVFACQNPSQSASSTSGRKTLPKSFLNRFTKIYLNELTIEDYQVIMKSVAGEYFPQTEQIDWLLSLTQEIENLYRSPLTFSDGSLTVNMRDLSRFIKVYEKALTDTDVSCHAIMHAFNSAYLMKEGITNKQREKCLNLVQESYLRLTNAGDDASQVVPKTAHIRVDEEQGLVFDGLIKSKVMFQNEAAKSLTVSNMLLADLLEMKGPQAMQLQSLSDCLAVNLPILLTTDDTTRLIKCLNLMAGIKKAELRRILLSDKSDTTQLLGCFEQTSQDLSAILQRLQAFKSRPELTASIMNLESELSQGPLDLQAQIKLIEKFLKHHAPVFEQLKPLISICKRGASRFEWVDSVLIKAISDGEWAVFENANICNPSILDRLNPLLEEGNQQMVINEQGLDDATQQLRLVEAHPNFRAIFVLSRKSLVEQGRDVSRALRNRCVELSITFSTTSEPETDTMGLNESLNDLAAESLDARNLDWSLAKLQTKFDLLPCDMQTDESSTDNTTTTAEVKLGKRTRSDLPQTTTTENETVKSNDEAYPFLFLEQAERMQGSQGARQEICLWKELDDVDRVSDGWRLYMTQRVSHLQNALMLRLKREMVTKQLQPFFNCLLTKPSEDCDVESLHFLLSNLLKARGLTQSLESALCLYLASRMQRIDIRETLLAVSQSSDRASELSFLFKAGFQESMQAGYGQALRRLGPNVVSEEALAAYLDQGLKLNETLNDQKVFMFKTSTERLSALLNSNDTSLLSGRVALTVRMLQGELDDEPRKATVILLNSEKDILPHAEMLKKLEDLDEPASVLETPNLVVIPFDQASKSVQGVVTSQSFLYDSLCDLKDWLRVQNGKAQNLASHFRSTKVPISRTLFQDEACSLVANQINLMARSTRPDQTGFYEERLMDAALIDQLTICVRDLPAFYACATSLTYKLDQICEMRGQQENKFTQLFDRLYSKKCLMNSEALTELDNGEDLRDTLTKLEQKLTAKITSINDQANESLVTLAKESSAGVLRSLQLIWSLEIEQVIQALIVLPLEVSRLGNSLEFADSSCTSYKNFYSYHLRSEDEAQRLIEPQLTSKSSLGIQMNQLQDLQAESGSKLSEKQQSQLRPLLAFTNNLLTEVKLIYSRLLELDSNAESIHDLAERCNTIVNLLESSTLMLLPMFNHIVSDLFTGCLNLVSHTRKLCLSFQCIDSKIDPTNSLVQSTVNLLPYDYQSRVSMIGGILRQTKNSAQKELNEKTLLWTLKLCKIQKKELVEQRALSHIFDYFVRREVAKRMAEERQQKEDAQTHYVPFKLQNQDIPECVGKAMDEWTKEDVARMEAEAEKEIETNFPSYFDEVQQLFFSGELTKKDYTRDIFTGKYRSNRVEIETVFTEILGVTKPEELSYILDFVKEKVEISKLSMLADRFEQVKRQFNLDTLQAISSGADATSQPLWQEDTVLLLKKMLSSGQGKKAQVMNISEVNLTKSYNFYHDAYPEEARIVYEPMQNLLIRLRDIVIRDEYESPLLNESIFLANYIITCFNSEQTPLMKLLTSMEFLLTKLEEWESTYASKRLNSVETEINTLKMLIIRYRKIQILSWRNLLSWRKDKMINEDVMDCCRLAHTLERQIFDLLMYKKNGRKGAYRKTLVKHKSNKIGAKHKVDNSAVQERTVVIRDEDAEQSIEAKVFELLDLFMRDSSLGVYQSRLIFIAFLRNHFQYKLDYHSARQPEVIQTRMFKVINVLAFILSYYGQFEEKLRKTVERLDSAARTKVKTLIDVGKWTVQKFSIVKNNIDKTHRQLNRACKDEEEALLQNVQTLVIASSRKKYAQTEDQLLSLHPDHESRNSSKPQITSSIEPFCPLAKQISFMASNTIEPLLPNDLCLTEATDGFMERLSEVRAINKKHVQVKAYYDLLRFMKSQGVVQSSFDSTAKIQQLLVDIKMADYSTTETKAHFYKSFETYTMLMSASQVDEFSHIKNAEVIRMQSFSRSLMLNILTLNRHLVESKKAIEQLRDLRPTCRLGHIEQEDRQIEGKSDDHMTESRLAQLKQSSEQIQTLLNDTKDRISLLSFQELEKDPGASIYSRSSQSRVTLSSLVSKLDCSLQTFSSFDCLKENAYSDLSSTLDTFEEMLALDVPSRFMRVRLVCDCALKRAKEIRTEGLDLVMMDDDKVADEKSTVQFDKNVKQVENMVKLSMQKMLNSYMALQDEDEGQSQRKASLTADSAVGIANPELPPPKEEKVRPPVIYTETTIVEMIAFAKTLKDIVQDEKVTKLATKARSVFALKGLQSVSEQTRQKVENTRDILEQLNSTLDQAQTKVFNYWKSMNKFSYLSQRVFIHLIYQGFCGQEDKDDPDEEPPSDLEAEGEQDGCGLGDGKGGQNNITDQIEHEEQLEGLKNYESDQEDQDEDQNDDKDDKGDDEEEDNDFEMKNDFDGDMDSEPEEKDPEDKKEDDEDDELDDVDDMLDNQLWDQNMEDMEQKEKEEQEKEDKPKDKEEIDLGDRDLDDQNLLPPQADDENMAEGDDEQDPKKQEEEKQQPENDAEDDQMQSGSEDADKDEDDGERDDDSEEENKDEIPLDKNEILAEDDEKFSEEAKSEHDDEQDSQADKEDTDEVDSKFSEDQGADEEENDSQKDDGDEDVDDVQQKADQAILEDDQIETKDQKQNEDEKDDKDQANLKRKNEAMQDQQQKPENKQQQAPQDDENQVSQADASGTDLLFEMSKQFQKRQDQKQAQKQEQQQRQHEKEDKDKQQVEEPQMVPDDIENEDDQQKRPDDQDMNDAAAEFVYDDKQAEMIQGKLATDQIDDEADDKDDGVQEQNPDGQADDMPMDEEVNKDKDDDAQDLQEEQIERTQAQFKETGTLKPDQKDKAEDDDDKNEDMNDQDLEEQKIDPRDLIDEYDEYLKSKAEAKMDIDSDDEQPSAQQQDQSKVLRFTQTLDQFDYLDQKAQIRSRFFEWLSDEREHTQALQLLAKFKNQTQSVSSSLCEQLRIVLEPQLSQNLQGDFKTGKRLNMKKVISFIASHYRNDKIWLRRTLPSKRDYKILIAIDDSMSMRENSQGFFSLEASIALTEALNRLEVGKVAVARIRDRMELVHSFDDTYTSEKAGFIVSQFEFEHQAPTSADYAMSNFVSDANKLLDMQNAGNTQAVNCPFVIVLSDGRFNKDNVRRYIREAKEKRYLYIFVILDKQSKTGTTTPAAQQPKSQSILNMRSAVKSEGANSRVRLVPYLKDFPFDYYCIISDISELPTALGTILVQWFSMVSASGPR